MHYKDLRQWQHAHVFDQDRKRPGEFRTITVILITATMMIVEIMAGILFGSIALLADGLHMSSHVVALGINTLAYVYSRHRAGDGSFSFGTGKINAMGGFIGAVLLVLFALVMAWESVERLVNPVEIAFGQAILVAAIGLVVNLASLLILGHGGPHEHSNEHHLDHDHNLKSAYLHVSADALTSVLAILALLSAKFLYLVWMDPLVGIAGAIMVSRWSFSLLRATTAVLLDRQGPERLRGTIRKAIESVGNDRISDLHLWSVGPNMYALIVCLVSHHPKSPSHYKHLIPDGLGLVHVTVEVHKCTDVGALGHSAA